MGVPQWHHVCRSGSAGNRRVEELSGLVQAEERAGQPLRPLWAECQPRQKWRRRNSRGLVVGVVSLTVALRLVCLVVLGGPSSRGIGWYWKPAAAGTALRDGTRERLAASKVRWVRDHQGRKGRLGWSPSHHAILFFSGKGGADTCQPMCIRPVGEPRVAAPLRNTWRS